MSAIERWRHQSLASGMVATGLLEAEVAHRTGEWTAVHQIVRRVVAAALDLDDAVGLYRGAPAVAFLLQAAAGASDRYAGALADLDGHVHELTHRRTAAALERIASGEHGAFGEYDIFYGLTGLGALLLKRAPTSSAMERVLVYLTALTRPRGIDRDMVVPGWWVGHDPRKQHSARFPAGHANLGLAHGIPGPLALLALAARRGHYVPGQIEAIHTILDWLEYWRQEGEHGPWWPETVALTELGTGRTAQRAPGRPSWCYGTPGIARAGQLAAIAVDDRELQQRFEQALTVCLNDTSQTRLVTDASVCHGWAGILHTVRRAAADAMSPDVGTLLPALAAQLERHQTQTDEEGLLTGRPGTDLALLTAHDEPRTGWDTCLLTC